MHHPKLVAMCPELRNSEPDNLLQPEQHRNRVLAAVAEERKPVLVPVRLVVAAAEHKQYLERERLVAVVEHTPDPVPYLLAVMGEEHRLVHQLVMGRAANLRHNKDFVGPAPCLRLKQALKQPPTSFACYSCHSPMLLQYAMQSYG